MKEELHGGCCMLSYLNREPYTWITFNKHLVGSFSLTLLLLMKRNNTFCLV